MTPEASRLTGAVAAAAALTLVVGVLLSSIFGSASGADGAIITHLKGLERDGVQYPLPAGLLTSSNLSYQRISVVLDADGQGATVSSTLDFTGVLVRGPAQTPTRVSSLGLERARYALRDGDWVAVVNDFPRLSAIVAALEARRKALELATPEADGGVPFAGVERRAYRSEAWFIRSEREDVAVAEDYRLTGNTRDRPVDERATTRLTLLEDAAGFFRFSSGTL